MNRAAMGMGMVIVALAAACAPRGQAGGTMGGPVIGADGGTAPLAHVDAGAADPPRDARDAASVDAGLAGAGAPVDAAPVRGRPAAIELSEYGLDPHYRASRSPPYTPGQLRVLDMLERLALVYARDTPPEVLHRGLGRPLGEASHRTKIAPASEDLELILVGEHPGDGQLEVWLVEPTTPRVLATRFGPLSSPFVHHRDDPWQIETAGIVDGGDYDVTVMVVYEQAPERHLDAPTRIVYLQRRRRPPGEHGAPMKARRRPTRDDVEDR